MSGDCTLYPKHSEAYLCAEECFAHVSGHLRWWHDFDGEPAQFFDRHA